MIEVTVQKPAALDFDEYAAMQAEAFAEVVGAHGMGSLNTPDYYRWKYNTPWGSAFIATVRKDQKLVAANAMYPLRIIGGTDSVIGWQSCDTATLPEARGQGLFMQCLHALQENLSDESIFFGFPNLNSVRGFEKLGWQRREELVGFTRFIPGRRLNAFPNICVSDSTLPGYDDLAARLVSADRPMIERCADYLRWRFFQHPLYQYEVFALSAQHGIDGYIVLREVTFNRRTMSLIMDLLAVDAKARGRLLRFAAAWSRSKRLVFTLLFTNALSRSSALRSAYIPIPARLMPKRQILMGAAKGSAAASLWDKSWYMQIGDWDGL